MLLDVVENRTTCSSSAPTTEKDPNKNSEDNNMKKKYNPLPNSSNLFSCSSDSNVVNPPEQEKFNTHRIKSVTISSKDETADGDPKVSGLFYRENYPAENQHDKIGKKLYFDYEFNE